MAYACVEHSNFFTVNELGNTRGCYTTGKNSEMKPDPKAQTTLLCPEIQLRAF